jgi:hypothetical protein
MQEAACLSNDDWELPAVPLPLAVALVLQPYEQAGRAWFMLTVTISWSNDGSRTLLANEKLHARQDRLTINSNSNHECHVTCMSHMCVCVVMWGGRSFGLHTPKVT